jgi:hypothetical protein
MDKITYNKHLTRQIHYILIFEPFPEYVSADDSHGSAAKPEPNYQR